MTKHIVDVLIEERAERLMRSPRIWRWVKKYCFSLFYYRQAMALVEEFKGASAQKIMTDVAANTNLKLSVLGLGRVPVRGAAIVVANHPAGIADGVALYAALRQKRPDICFFANRDAARCAPQLQDVIIPVEWSSARRSRAKSRETLKAIKDALTKERLIVIFPSGRLARPTPFGLRERPWASSAIAIAQKHDLPIVPINIKARNSLLYYLLFFCNTELKDLTLFRELLLPRKKSYQIRIGHPCQPGTDAEKQTDWLYRHVVSELSQSRVLPKISDRVRTLKNA